MPAPGMAPRYPAPAESELELRLGHQRPVNPPAAPREVRAARSRAGTPRFRSHAPGWRTRPDRRFRRRSTEQERLTGRKP